MRARIFALLALLAVLADFLFVTLTGIHSVYAAPAPADFAIILGNKIAPDGTPERRLRARLDEGLQLYRQRLAQHLLVSGGIERDGGSEAASMAQYLIEHGVPRAAIIEDPTGRNTFHTALAASKLITPGQSIIVVSQWFHIARTQAALRRCGLHPVQAAAPTYVDVMDLYGLAREMAGVPIYPLLHRHC